MIYCEFRVVLIIVTLRVLNNFVYGDVDQYVLNLTAWVNHFIR